MGRDIVLFMTDQQRADQVGFASGGHFETTALDRLAERGVRFDAGYSSSTTCVPSRVGMLTGVHSRRVPWWQHWPAIKPGFWTVAHAMRAAGYRTVLVGKMHFTPVHADHGFDEMRTAEHVGATNVGLRPDGLPDVDDYHQWLVDEGLAEWGPLEVGEVTRLQPRRPEGVPRKVPFPYDIRYHATTWIEQQINDILDARTDDRPLFLVVSYMHPHTPVNPLGPYARMYDPADAVLPGEDLSVNDGLPEPFRRAFTDRTGGFDAWRVDLVGEDVLREHLTGVRALIRQIDDSMRRLLRRFDLGRTVVAFTSDHGDYAGHRGVGMKMPWIPFEDLVRVPLVFAGAGIAGGRTITTPVQTLDLAQTFCELAGEPVHSDQFDGRSLVPFLDGSVDADPEPRPTVFSAWGWPGIRLGRWKAIVHPQTDTTVLFDLEADPGERHDVAGDPANTDVLDELRKTLRQVMNRGSLQELQPDPAPAA